MHGVFLYAFFSFTLFQLLKHVTIPCAGVLPKIHSELIGMGTASTQKAAVTPPSKPLKASRPTPSKRKPKAVKRLQSRKRQPPPSVTPTPTKPALTKKVFCLTSKNFLTCLFYDRSFILNSDLRCHLGRN